MGAVLACCGLERIKKKEADDSPADRPFSPANNPQIKASELEPHSVPTVTKISDSFQS